MLESFGRFVHFSGRAMWALPAALIRRPGSVVREFERVAWGSMPLVLAAGASVGLVTWLQTRRLLVVYGLEATLPSILAAAIFIETGPMLASLLVAGRLGAGLAAELASMVLTEEIDARDVLGAPAVTTLVAPRVLACALAIPLLTIVLDVAALAGGLAAELAAGSLSAELFGARALDFLRLSDIIPATLKTTVFGLLIGIVACWTGLSAARTTEAVGRAATRGVVRAMLALFLADVVLVPCIQAAVEAAGWRG
jgi:phospholipid/cholesterol/gamma-HCH transport system permease protein